MRRNYLSWMGGLLMAFAGMTAYENEENPVDNPEINDAYDFSKARSSET